MGLFNILKTSRTCPHCHTLADFEIECKFGDTSAMHTYHLGDHYPWRPGKAIQNGGPPQDGYLDGEGYTQCPSCHRDFFVRVEIRHNIIEAVRPDLCKPPYIST